MNRNHLPADFTPLNKKQQFNQGTHIKLQLKTGNSTSSKKAIILTDDKNFFLRTTSHISTKNSKQGQLEEKISYLEREQVKMKSKLERDNQSLIKKLNDSEKKFTQILQILIKKQKELEKGMNILQKCNLDRNENKCKQQVIIEQIKKEVKSTKVIIDNIYDVDEEPFKNQNRQAPKHFDVSPQRKSMNNQNNNSGSSLNEFESNGKKLQSPNRSRTMRFHDTAFEHFDEVKLKESNEKFQRANTARQSFQEFNQKMDLLMPDPNPETASADEGTNIMTSQPVFQNYFNEHRNPKLINHLRESSQQPTARKLSINSSDDQCNVSQKSQKAESSKEEDDDQGEINQSEIEEKSPIIAQRSHSKSNQISVYKSTVPASNQQRSSENNRPQSVQMVTFTQFSAKEILSMKGSKCICNRYQSGTSTPSKAPQQRTKFQINSSIITPQKNMKIQIGQSKCGTFCKYLSSNEQKHVIKHYMKLYGEKNGITEKSLIFMHQANVGEIGEKKFIISSQWWRKWCDYANFGNNMDQSVLLEQKNSNNEESQLNGSQKGSAFVYSVYEQPGIINNEKLLKKKQKGNHLKSNLIEHFDYEVVCTEVWQHIYSWYSADICIPRTLTRDQVNKNKVFLDLYPEEKIDEYNPFSYHETIAD